MCSEEDVARIDQGKGEEEGDKCQWCYEELQNISSCPLPNPPFHTRSIADSFSGDEEARVGERDGDCRGDGDAIVGAIARV